MKVLVIDDDKFFRTLLESEMRQENIDVQMVSDGDEGITKVKTWKPDAVVLDLILPKKDGFEVLEQLKKTAEGRHASIFIFTTLAQEHDKAEALALGARGYFTKSADTVTHVVEAVRTIGS